MTEIMKEVEELLENNGFGEGGEAKSPATVV